MGRLAGKRFRCHYASKAANAAVMEERCAVSQVYPEQNAQLLRKMNQLSSGLGDVLMCALL